MKYITTDKHPELKKGLEIIFNDYNSRWQTQTGLFRLTEMLKDAVLIEGYIKDLQEPQIY